MTISISGATADDRGPAGCLVRFILAGAAGDNAAAMVELHPDCHAHVSGDVKSPPGVTAVALDEPQAVGDGMHIPARLSGPDGPDQPFVFVVRPVGDRWGVDLDQSLKATFGGDPLEMMGEALRTAVAPLGAAMDAMGEALGEAFNGTAGSDSDQRPAAKRIAADAPAPDGNRDLPTAVVAHLIDLDLRRRIQRSDANEEFTPSTELSARLRLDLDPAWCANACLGATIEQAASVAGEDLIPADADPGLGSESYASWERERREFNVRLNLAAPQQPFAGLQKLSGTVRLTLVGGELLEIALGPLGGLLGQSIPLAIFGLEVQIARDDDGNLILRSPSGWTDQLSEIRPIDVNGESLNDSWSSSGDGEYDTRTYGSSIPDDASLLIQFWSQSGQAELAFTVEGLPASLS